MLQILPTSCCRQGAKTAYLVNSSKDNERYLIYPRGGTNGYTTWYRNEQLAKHQNNGPVEVSEASISRWKRRINAHCRAGNHNRTKLVGIDMINLVIFIIAHPDALLNEMDVFIYLQ